MSRPLEISEKKDFPSPAGSLALAPFRTLLSERFDDAWEAKVDGSGAPVLRADGILRAVPVGAGEHTVELSFRPWEYVWGARISLISALFTAVGVAIYLSRRMWQPVRLRVSERSQARSDR